MESFMAFPVMNTMKAICFTRKVGAHINKALAAFATLGHQIKELSICRVRDDRHRGSNNHDRKALNWWMASFRGRMDHAHWVLLILEGREESYQVIFRVF
jgi:hypothetical protein